MSHIPVLKNEIVEAFRGLSGFILDGTFGGGGHSRAILADNENVSIVALDVDLEAEKRALDIEKEFHGRLSFYRENYSNLCKFGNSFCGILFDFGVSSFQLDEWCRGFSFRLAGPLDMRMANDIGESAKDFLLTASAEDLAIAIRDFGEEKHWRAVVNGIIEARNSNVFDDTLLFANFLEKLLGRFYFKQKIHPATRVFQGIRMFVNRELEHIEKALPKAFEALTNGGILAIISFHSLEDRLVKRFFNEKAGKSVDKNDFIPRQFKKSSAEILTKKPITPSADELELNSRSRSAKLRILRKVL